MALLNSKTSNFRYKSIGKQTGSGVFEYFESRVSKLPIPVISIEEQEPFILKIDAILQAKLKGKDTSVFESGIDNMVYKLYGLTDVEIQTIDPEFSPNC